MNKTMLLGRLTKDAEVRYTNDGLAIARFTVAVNRRKSKDGEQSADFISCVAFGKTAEVIEQYTEKGNRVTVYGRLETGSYENKEGQKVYTTTVMVEEIEIIDFKSEETHKKSYNNNKYRK